MTDTTELAQRVERIISDMKLKHGGSDTYAPVMKWGEFLALVEALEYYKSREERVTSLVRDNSKSWDELYRQVEAKGKRNVELVEALASEKRICATWRKTATAVSEKLEKAHQCITELKSRTVKLPPKVDSSNIPFAGHTWNCCLDEVEKRLASAGIKAEAE